MDESHADAAGWPAGTFAAGLTAGQRSDLLSRGVERRFDGGATLMNQGDRGDSVAVLLRGVAKIWALSADGHETLLGLRTRGDLLGEMAVTARVPRTARVVASTPVLACVLTDREFRLYLDRWPGAAIEVAATVARRLRTANERRAEFRSRDAAQRVAAILYDTAARVGQPVGAGRGGSSSSSSSSGTGGVSIGPEVTQGDLASLAAVALSTVERILQDFERDGLVVRHRRALILPDPAVLLERSGPGPGNPRHEGSRA